VKRSAFAERVLECMEALDALCREFPDPDRRPYGEKALQMEIELPFGGYQGIERVIEKIKTKRWTEYDIARINGMPKPETKSVQQDLK